MCAREAQHAAAQTRRRATITRERQREREEARVYDCISSTAGRTHDNELNYVSLYRVTMRSQNYASTAGTSSPRHVTAVMSRP